MEWLGAEWSSSCAVLLKRREERRVIWTARLLIALKAYLGEDCFEFSFRVEPTVWLESIIIRIRPDEKVIALLWRNFDVRRKGALTSSAHFPSVIRYVPLAAKEPFDGFFVSVVSNGCKKLGNTKAKCPMVRCIEVAGKPRDV